VNQVYANDFNFGNLILILSLHYLVKFRSICLAIYNNEFILGSACVGSEMMNWIATNTSDSYYYYLSKSHMSHHIIMCSKCPPPAQMQAVHIDAAS